MLIVCPSCASEYAVDSGRIGAGGRQVRCASCRASWFVPAPDKTGPADGGRMPAIAASAAASPSVIEGEADYAGLDRRVRPGTAKDRGPPPAGKAWPKMTRTDALERLALASTALVALAVPAALLLREPIVRAAPASAALFSALGLPVNLVGLRLDEVASSTGEEGGVRVLLVEGAIRTAGERRMPAPRLHYVVEGADGAPLYRWSTKPPVPEIAPGEAVRFTARLSSPPPEARRVVVSFSTGRDGDAVALR